MLNLEGQLAAVPGSNLEDIVYQGFTARGIILITGVFLKIAMPISHHRPPESKFLVNGT